LTAFTHIAYLEDKSPSLEQVTEVFEEIYQGTESTPGLCESEYLIPSRGFLAEIYRRCAGKVAVVTGRPRKDCDKFLVTHNLVDLFPVCICMEDAPAKPDPAGVLMACKGLGVDPANALMVSPLHKYADIPFCLSQCPY
jgi:HAD superfamily hydrolase (TIGR01548 family)